LKKGIPFQRSILLNITAGVLLLGLCLLVISLWATNRSVERLSASLTKRVIATTDARLQGFFEPVQVALEISAERVHAGEFETFRLDPMDRYFAPLINQLPQLSAINYAHGDGEEYLLLQDGGGWKSRHTRPDAWGGSAEWREWSDGDKFKPVERRDINYDARTRPWFIGAMKRLSEVGKLADMRDQIHWTAPYRFFTNDQPGLSASLAQTAESGRMIILSFDVLLSDISRFTSKLEIGERGKAFVLRGEPDVPAGLVVVGLPADDRFADEELLVEFILSPPDELGGPVASFIERFGNAGSGNVMPFLHEGERWWGALARSELKTTANIWVGSVVPESELLEGLPRSDLIVMVVTAIILVFAVWRSFQLAARYAAPIEELTESGNRMQRLNFEPVEPVQSHITEIRHLSTTLDRMRNALQTYSSAREDVRVARTIRAMTLPKLDNAPLRFDLHAWQEAGLEVGGEVFDVVALPDSEAGLAVAHFDCPGTGVSAAVFGNQLRSAFRAIVAVDSDPREVCSRLERFLEDDLPNCVPVRGWILRLAGNPLQLEALGLGMDALLLRQGGRVKRIASEGYSLGLPVEWPLPPVQRVSLGEGDVLVLASDGILDALDSRRGRFGLGGLEQACRELEDFSAAALVDKVRALLAGYPPTPSGDRTLLVIRVLS
jgi:serine phosphatase RsbU (regulator of sigma subunit)